MWNRSVALILFLSVAFPAAASAAVPVYEGEDASFSVDSLTRVGYRVQETDGTTTADTFLRFGRIGVRGTLDDIGSARVVGEFAGGAQLLDIIGELNVFDPLTVRAGFYKSPLSLEFDTAPDAIPFVGRTLLLGRVAPARLAGTELEVNLGEENLNVEGRVGLWNPADLPLREDGYNGQYIIAKFGVGFGWGRTHLAFLEHVFADNPTVPAERPAPYDRQLDFGVILEPGPARLILEGLVSFEGPDGENAYAAHGQFYYRIGEFPSGFAWAPAVAYDFVDDAAPGADHQGRVGVNFHYQGLMAVVGFYYGGLYNTDNEILAHTGEAQLQLSF